jgi:GR25 family glycosyltransferase involved in LPS biosynthesis
MRDIDKTVCERIVTKYLKVLNCQEDTDEAYNVGLLCEQTGNTNTAIRTGLAYVSLLKQDYTLSFDLCCKLLNDYTLSESECNTIRTIKSKSIDKLSDRYVFYNPERVGYMTGILLKNRKKPESEKNITITMTTCKRYDLFYNTICSFLNCCTDLHLVDEWLVVDDNSNEEDVLSMISDFPFIKYITKTEEQSGHAKSMNIILENTTTPLIFHIEDDWNFITEKDYLTTCKNILEIDLKYGQALVNRGYGERGQCHDIYTGNMKFHPTKNIRYYEHAMDTPPVGLKNCSYWPHYSLRVGMTRRDVYDKVGTFNETEGCHFEMEYGKRYTSSGYTTVFMDSLYCYHTGRCTFERGDTTKKNAYDLNGQSQFGEPNKNLSLTPEESLLPTFDTSVVVPEYENKYRLKTVVLNLKRRTDRLKNFVEKNHTKLQSLQYTVFDAVDGNDIAPLPKILKTFESGDYCYRKGIMGCALSHIKMWRDFIVCPDNDTLLVLEDDIELCNNFVEKLSTALRRVSKDDLDILFLGHFLYPQYITENDKADVLPTVKQWSLQECTKYSMGGTIGYVITKRGAIKMLKHIVENGVYNAIDWVMFKTANINNIYYCYPHLVYSECVVDDKKPDSDIQYDHSSLCQSDYIRVLYELDYWCKVLQCTGVNFVDKKIEGIKHDSESKVLYLEGTTPTRYQLLTSITFNLLEGSLTDAIKNFSLDKLPIKYYTIRDYVLICVPETKITSKVLEDVCFSGMLNIDNV